MRYVVPVSCEETAEYYRALREAIRPVQATVRDPYKFGEALCAILAGAVIADETDVAKISANAGLALRTIETKVLCTLRQGLVDHGRAPVDLADMPVGGQG